jgi:hypothetical protein
MNPIDRILALAKEKGIKQSHLNELICGYRGKFTDLKNGKSSLTEGEYAIIADELGTSTEFLKFGDENIKTPSDFTESASEDDFIILRRKAGQVPPEQRKRLYKFLDSTIDNFLEALKDEESHK